MTKTMCGILLGLVMMASGSNALAIDPSSNYRYDCFGTEPFWGMKINKMGAKADFSFDGKMVAMPRPQIQSFEGYGEEVGLVYTSSLRGKPTTAIITSGPCSDGMSDSEHQFTTYVLIGGRAYYGCCNKY